MVKGIHISPNKSYTKQATGQEVGEHCLNKFVPGRERQIVQESIIQNIYNIYNM